KTHYLCGIPKIWKLLRIRAPRPLWHAACNVGYMALSTIVMRLLIIPIVTILLLLRLLVVLLKMVAASVWVLRAHGATMSRPTWSMHRRLALAPIARQRSSTVAQIGRVRKIGRAHV